MQLKHYHPHTWRAYFLAVLILFPFFFLAYGYYEQQHLKIKTIIIHNKALAEVIPDSTILFLSDLHITNRPSKIILKTLQAINKVQPDIIFLGGDYVDWRRTDDIYETAIQFLTRLHAPLGVFAVLGDADSASTRKSCEFCHQARGYGPSTRHNVTMLKNSGKIIHTGHGRFFVYGINSEDAEDISPKLREKMPNDIPTIILAHRSVIFNSISTESDTLVLSGDTHGGQIHLLLFLWKILGYKPDPDHMYGLFQNGNKSLYVTSGVGTSILPIRIGVPPEVVGIKFAE